MIRETDNRSNDLGQDMPTSHLVLEATGTTYVGLERVKHLALSKGVLCGGWLRYLLAGISIAEAVGSFGLLTVVDAYGVEQKIRIQIPTESHGPFRGYRS